MYYLKFSDIEKRYKEIITYCLETSDCFSVITWIDRCGDVEKEGILHSGILSEWKDYLKNQIIGIKEWPGTETLSDDYIMNLYYSDEFQKGITELPNLFLPQKYGLPEDVCFYRNEKPWFVTVSHEKMAWMEWAEENDLDLLKKIRVDYRKYEFIDD